jgi:hypothetical protein
MTSTKTSGKATFYQRVDDAFYAQVKAENGGTLPPDLIGRDGKPRKLTMSPRDRAYRKQWTALAAKMRTSKAVAKKPVTSPCIPCAAAKALQKKPVILPGIRGKPVNVGSVLALEPASHAVASASANPKGETAAKTEPCKHETLTVQCGHGERGFKIQLPAAAGEDAPDQLEVIDDGDEKITCTAKITGGPCGAMHKGKVFDLNPEHEARRNGDGEMVFDATYDSDLRHASFSDLFPPGKRRSPATFHISTDTCQQEQALSATVMVYPQVDWNLDISLGIGGQGSVKDKDGVPTEDRSSELEFSGSVAVTTQGLKHEFGIEINHELQQALKFADLACQTAEFMWTVANDIGGIEVTFDYPHLSFAGNWGWREIEGSPKCGYSYDWKLGLSPLVGAEFKVDILSFLITKFAGIGQIIERIRKSIEKEAQISVFFAIEGKLSGTFDYAKTVGQPSDGSGDLGGELEFTLEGDIKSRQYHFLCFHAGGEAKIGGHATFSGAIKGGTDGDGPYWQGELKFEGLEIYAIVEGGIGLTNDAPPDDDPGDGDESGNIHYGDEWTLTVIPEKTLFATGEKHHFMDEDGED